MHSGWGSRYEINESLGFKLLFKILRIIFQPQMNLSSKKLND